MNWPQAVDAQGWMRKTERRLTLLERKPSGAGGVTSLAVQDTSTLDLTLTDDGAGGYTLKGDVLGGSGGTTPNPLVPIGSILEWSGSTLPAGFLWCDGSAVSRTTYADLFAAIGTTYGVGDNSTTFNLPNRKGKVGVGRDAAQTEFDVLGETGGTKTETLTLAQMPAHTHNVGHGNAGADSFIYSGGTDGYTFGINVDATNGPATAWRMNTDSRGGGGSHNNLQPYIVVNYIINAQNSGGGGGGGQTTIAVQDTATLDLTLTGSPATGYTIKGDVLQAPTSLAVQDTATVDLTLTGTPATGYTLKADVIGSSAVGTIGVVGEIIEWPTSTAPTDFLLCQGQAVSRTTYAALFAVIGTTYGVGDNSTTFNVPDRRGRVGVGMDSTQTEFDALAKTGGAKTVALTLAQMAEHSHSAISTGGTGGPGSVAGWTVGGASAAQNTSFASTGITPSPGTGGQAHPNLQPYLTVNYAIRYRTSLGASDNGTWKLASDQAIGNGAFTLLAAATAVGTPTAGLFSNTGGAITVLSAGTYQVLVSAKWATNTSGSRRYVSITKNATGIDGSGNVLGGGSVVGVAMLTPSPAGDFPMECFSHRFSAVANDVIRVFVFQDSGSSVNVLVGASGQYYGETLVSVNRA